MQLPRARTADIIEQEADKELLIYDLRTNKMFQLNETSKTVYQACGKLSFDDLKREHKLTDDLIHLALDELSANGLLENYESDHFSNLSRREVVRRVGLATMVALPVISALIVPKSAQAASSRCPVGQRFDVELGRCVSICRNDQVFDPQTRSCVCLDASTTNCFGACVNTSNDRNNCGGCGSACPAGRGCVAGTCRSPSGIACTSSEQCPAGEDCRNGVCLFA